MRVVFWGSYDTGKPRTRILREGLCRNGVDLTQIHASVWEDVEDKSQLRGPGRLARIALKWVFAYPRLAWRLGRITKPDLVLVGYPGHVDIFVAAIICRLRGIPLAWDIFLSAYDTICLDRRLLRANGIPGRILRWVEGMAIRRADCPFMDTHAHARRIETLFDLPPHRCDAVWVGVEETVFSPAQAAPLRDGPFRILFYGQFIPLHGIPTILGAARILRDHDIDWQLVGRGQEAARVRASLNEDPLPRVNWLEWVPYNALRQLLGSADLCLGIFGASDKAASVIPNKVFQIVASGRPLITRDGPGVRELLTPSPGCTYLIPCGDAHALADAVLEHKARHESTPSRCHDHARGQIGSDAIGKQFIDMIRRRKIAGCPSQ